MSKVWFITGASKGFGRIWAEAALKRGDLVAATARDPKKLSDLKAAYQEKVLILPLDVTNRKASFNAVRKAHKHFGRLDVVVNNAGYGLFGNVEDISEAQARAQMETNFFGALWVTQAAIPFLREQKSGHFLQVSSIGGIAAFASLGLYNASKWALEAMSESLSKEVASFGVHVTLLEPGPFATDWRDVSSVKAPSSTAYAKPGSAGSGLAQGDPKATAEAVLKLVDAQNPPLRLFLGSGPLDVAKASYAERLATWESWDVVSKAAQGK